MASSEDPSLLKRKRSSQAHAADGPAWKRPAIEAYPLDDKAREQLRSGVSSLFNHYQSLHNAEADGADVVNFQALLDAAQGDCVSRRLAARLIPRFIAKLPQQADTAAAILIDLHEYKQPALHAVTVHVNQTRRDALQGLGSIIAAVPADAAGNGHLPGSNPVVPPALARVLDYLLRLLLECSDGDNEPAEEGELDNGAMIATLLRKAFCTQSQAVLMFLSKALQSSDPELQQGARAFISRHLLSERLLQQKHKHKHSRSSTPSNMDEDGDLGPSTSGAEGPAKCLAAEVLLASEALQSWLQESIRAARKDPKSAGSREGIGLMERLLQLLPPPVPPDPTPAQQQQQQQQQALERQGSREHRHHQQHHHQQHHHQQQQQQLHERRASGGLASTANGVGGAQQHGSAVNGNVHAATLRLASLSTAELAAQRDDHWRERRDLFPPPGGSVCRAEPCLWLGGLPPNATRSMLLAALSRYSAPKELHLLDGPGQDEACAVFASVKEAAFCFEATAGTQLLGPSPLRVEFCGTMPSHSPLARAPTYRPSSHIWLSAGGVAWSPHDIASVIVGAGLLQPLQIFTVGGAAPGYLVQLPHASHVDAAVAALQRRARELGAGHPGYHSWQGRQQQQQQQQSPGGGGYAGPGRAASMPHPPQQPPLQRHPSSGYAGPMPMDLDPPGPGNTPGAVLPSPAGPGGSNAPGSSGSCSLWLGNLANEVPDEEYLKAFGRFGKLLGHKFLRSSACAFVDFASPAAAARAKEELHSKWFGKCQLRIDFARGARPGGNGPPLPGSGNTPLPNGATAAGAGSALGPGMSGRPHFGRSSSAPGPPQQPGAHTPQHQQQWRQHEQQQQGGPGSQEPATTPFGSSGQRLARTHSGRHSSPPLPFALNGPSTGPAAAAGPAGGPSGAHMPHAAAAAAHGATPPLPPVAPPPLPAVPPPGGTPAWSGMLCKSGSQYCTAQCRNEPPPAGTAVPPAALGPGMWPPRLDVTLRVPIPQMLDFYKAAAAHGRAVRWLEPGPGSGDAVGLHKFARYLSERERAGVVKMPADGSLPPRTMYIVSPEQGVCAQLGVQLVAGGVLLAVVIFARPA